MDIKGMVEAMKARGMTFRVEGSTLKMSPKGEATETEIVFIRENMAGVLEYVMGGPADLGEDSVEYTPSAKRISTDEYIARFQRHFGAKGVYYHWPRVCVEELRGFMNEHPGSKLLYESGYAFTVIVEFADGTQHEFKRTRWSDEQEKAGIPDRKKVTA